MQTADADVFGGVMLDRDRRVNQRSHRSVDEPKRSHARGCRVAREIGLSSVPRRARTSCQVTDSEERDEAEGVSGEIGFAGRGLSHGDPKNAGPEGGGERRRDWSGGVRAGGKLWGDRPERPAPNRTDERATENAEPAAYPVDAKFVKKRKPREAEEAN